MLTIRSIIKSFYIPNHVFLENMLKVLSIRNFSEMNQLMIANIAIKECPPVGWTLIIYSCIHSSKDLMLFSHITSGSNFRTKFTVTFNWIARCFNLVPLKGIVWKQHFINPTTWNAAESTLRVHSQSAL